MQKSGGKAGYGIALALLATGAAASAQTTETRAPSSYEKAIAAGYKALTLCSGVFNAGRSQEQIEALELTGIYPQYDAIVPGLTAQVDRQRAAVTVAFDEAMPPRRAEWRRNFGCTIEPIGAVARPSTPHPRATTVPAPGPAGADPRAWPMGDKGVAPKPSRQLSREIDRTFNAAQGAGTRTTAVVIVRDGKIIGERYAEGFGPFTSQRTWSVAKSVTATLVGIASANGAIDLAKAASIPEWQDEPAENLRRRITVDNLLRMASGLHSATAGNRTDALYFGGTAVTEETTSWPVETAPGTRYRYANNDTLLAVRSLRTALDEAEYRNFPRKALFEKIGMTHSVAETDWRGNFILSSQMWATARDLARFGMLYADRGMWNGTRLLPESWIDYVASPKGPQPDGDFGYGAGFWLLSRSPGVPADSFAAFGNRGQYVVIIPSRKIVLVRRGEDPAGARFDVAKFTADILAAIG